MEMKSIYFTEDNPLCKDNFQLTLSVSTKEVHSKDEGKMVTEFEGLTIDSTDEDSLKSVLTSRNYSMNVWQGTCSNINYTGMTGVILDFDGGVTMEQARETFADFNYILHTSSSHQSKEPLCDRFRMILPFAPGPVRFPSVTEHEKVYRKVLQAYPQADQRCADPAHKYFPHTNERGAEFIWHVNATGRYFDVDISDVPDGVLKKVRLDYQPPDELNTREELDRMLKFDPFIQWCQEHAEAGLDEPLWHAMISNLCRFEGGRELIHEISAKDMRAGYYDGDETDAKIEHTLESSGPIGYAEIVRRGWPREIPAKPAAPAGWGKLGRVLHREPSGEEKVIHIHYDDELIVRLDDAWEVTDLMTLKHELLPKHRKIQVICPFCDQDNAEAGTDTFHFTYIWCEKCQRRFYEHPEAPGLFAYKGELMRVEVRSDRFISLESLKKEHFRTSEEYNFVRRRVLNDPSRSFLSDNFQLRRIGSVDFDRLGYEFDVDSNAIVFRYPALPVKLQDNDLVNQFIEGMFGDCAEFIKNWMAMYAYTNYVKLPVIVLAGDRYAGKNTFAEMVGQIFPKLLGLWDGDVKQFNAQFTNKLLFVDENRNTDKPVQYTELKRLTGNEKIPINQKFEPEYIAPNNLNIIIATNDARPLYLKWGEEPRDERVNNFFIYQCTSVPEDQLDSHLKQKLEDRLGNYVRTELKTRYDRLAGAIDPRNRYTLPAPITEFAQGLYASSRSSVEEEAEILAECIVRGVKPINAFDERGPKFTPVPHPDKDEFYIASRQLLNLIGSLKLKASRDMKAYTNALIRMKVIRAYLKNIGGE